MLFMAIEKFKHDRTKEIYYRSQKEGRMLPEGLKYIDSWIDVNLNRCFQLMECDDLRHASKMDIAMARFS